MRGLEWMPIVQPNVRDVSWLNSRGQGLGTGEAHWGV